MKNLLALVALAVISVAVAGWYLNWYQINSAPSEGGRQKVTIDFNTPKITHDLEEGKQRVAKILENAGNSNNQQSPQTQSAADFPTFTNPVAQSGPSQQHQQQQAQQQPAQKIQPVEFQTSKDGYFVIPNKFVPPQSQPKK